jgi:hypothetical protein
MPSSTDAGPANCRPLVVTLGALGITVLNCSSVIHCDTSFPDSSACSEVSKRPSELRTPSLSSSR